MAVIRGQTGASAFLAGLMQPRPMNQRQAWEIIEPMRCALQRVLDGAGDRHDVGLVGVAMNQTWLRLKRAGGRKPDMVLVEDAVRALERCSQQPNMQPDADQAEALKVAINIYDPAVRTSSLQQWADVEVELLERVKAGGALV